MGYYENAFRLMRDCYEELARSPGSRPIATWREAFAPADFVATSDQRPDGSWCRGASISRPSPGFPATGTQRLVHGARLPRARAVELVRTLLQTLDAGLSERASSVASRARGRSSLLKR